MKHTGVPFITPNTNIAIMQSGDDFVVIVRTQSGNEIFANYETEVFRSRSDALDYAFMAAKRALYPEESAR